MKTNVYFSNVQITFHQWSSKVKVYSKSKLLNSTRSERIFVRRILKYPSQDVTRTTLVQNLKCKPINEKVIMCIFRSQYIVKRRSLTVRNVIRSEPLLNHTTGLRYEESTERKLTALPPAGFGTSRFHRHSSWRRPLCCGSYRSISGSLYFPRYDSCPPSPNIS